MEITGEHYAAKSKSAGASAAPLQAYAFTIGDVAFVTAPYEMFSINGQQIKHGSPFSMTFVATCANMTIGYFPTEFAYDLESSYEASPGSTNVV